MQLQDTRQSLDPSLSSADAKELCDNLNTFYVRFDSIDNYSTLIDELETVCDNDNPIDIREHEVCLLFKELNSRKSPGPDNISPLLLKSCHNELSGVYQHLFQLSISSGIPRIQLYMENCCNCTENHCKRVQWLQTDSSDICAFQMPWTHFVKTCYQKLKTI